MEFCDFINDCYKPEDIKVGKCTNDYEKCSERNRRVKGLEEEVLGVGSMMVPPGVQYELIK